MHIICLVTLMQHTKQKKTISFCTQKRLNMTLSFFWFSVLNLNFWISVVFWFWFSKAWISTTKLKLTEAVLLFVIKTGETLWKYSWRCWRRCSWGNKKWGSCHRGCSRPSLLLLKKSGDFYVKMSDCIRCQTKLVKLMQVSTLVYRIVL